MAVGGIDRRTLLIGGGAAAGLLVAWGLWPRSYKPNLRAAPGETLFNAYLKIGLDGRVIVAVPQAEIGQGVYTSLPQVLADELGADWRTVAVEPAPISPIYANRLLAGERVPDSVFAGFERWAAEERAGRGGVMMTGSSTSIRAFEAPFREAGAAARALLMKAAADRWDADWETLDTAQGFVLNGNERLSFAELAAEAADYDLPENLPIRGGIDNRLVGQPLPRIDLPAKVDGSAQFAADVRLPDMVFASVRQGPRGRTTRLVEVDRKAADAVPGVLAVFENPRWAGAVATNWWAADQAVQAMKPVFQTGWPASAAGIDAALSEALEKGPRREIFSTGDIADALQGPNLFAADYAVGLAPTAALEPLTATARVTDGRIEVWTPTQAPSLARAAAARAAGVDEARVTLYPMLVGSGYGRKIEAAAIEQAVEMALCIKRPVQLTWSRAEEIVQDMHRPPAQARLRARIGSNGAIVGWSARIAAPSTDDEVMERLRGEKAAHEASHLAVAGAVPPYAVPAVAVEHVPVDIGLSTGLWRSGAHSYTAFFTECFVDELARRVSVEPLSFRIPMLGQNLRLARVLQTAASLGGWDGGAAGSAMGLACHSAFGSYIALVVEVEVSEAQRVRVLRAVAAVDCGRVINPEIVKQLIEGGLVYGIAGATGASIDFEEGLPAQRTLGTLGLPRLADTPEIMVEILPSEEEPGGVTELAVPPVAPAIANALFALTGQRLRSLPLVPGTAQ
ncbi:MAG TPA: molybdopterin cofactor-binding domain-containing protein [Allosphingosinicella sp.]|uniref:xanthine dehydrogenase family protein molybdopterin-binding subunit n=1 Tax=Allosphingosinicella sp. TaxID=2823234 RepID=UPI002EDB6F39